MTDLCCVFLQGNEYMNMNGRVKEEGKNITNGYMNVNGSVKDEGENVTTEEEIEENHPAPYLVSDRLFSTNNTEYLSTVVISHRTQCLW